MRQKIQVDFSQKGIWKYHKYLSPLSERFRLSLNEGETPLVQKNGIFLKREDLNPTGSLKDRGIAYQVSQALAKKEKNLVISSSGNAAISAAHYCKSAGINLYVFLPKNIQSEKIKIIEGLGGKIFLSKRPLSDSIKFSNLKKYKNLRPSVDPAGIEGYKTIALELLTQIGEITDIFLPVSSATCLVGVAEGFAEIGTFPRFYACQSTKTYQIASFFDKDFVKTKTSLAKSLVDKVALRKNQALEIIKKSKGFGWVISDEQILNALNWLKQQKIETSAEGALAVAALWKARAKNFKIGKKVVCILTGKKY